MYYIYSMWFDIYLSIHPYIHPSIHLSIYRSIYLYLSDIPRMRGHLWSLSNRSRFFTIPRRGEHRDNFRIFGVGMRQDFSRIEIPWWTADIISHWLMGSIWLMMVNNGYYMLLYYYMVNDG